MARFRSRATKEIFASQDLHSILIFANQAGGTDQAQAVEYALDGSLLRKFTSRGGGYVEFRQSLYGEPLDIVE